MVRSEVSRESAEVISETIRDERLQFTAREFSKELLNQLLNDEEIAKIVAKWVMTLLVKIQDDIGALFVRILHQEQVVQAVNRLADRLVAYLCSNRTIQEQVGQLLVDAICLQSSRDASAQWAYDLVMREDVTCGFRDLVVAALQMDAVVSEAQSLAVSVLNRILQDPETISEARHALRETLRDSELRATAKESLWNIVLPWTSSKAPANDTKKVLKSLDELMVLESLTPEEKQILKAVQLRLRSGTSTSSPKASVPSTGEAATVTNSATAAAAAAAAAAAPTEQQAANDTAKDDADRREKDADDRKAKEENEQRRDEEARLKAAADVELMARHEAERQATVRAEEEARQKAAAEAERRAREEAERREEEARQAEEEARQKAMAEEERKAHEEARRREQEAALQMEEGRRKAAVEAERMVHEQLERQDREQESKAMEEAAGHKAREEAELKRQEQLGQEMQDVAKREAIAKSNGQEGDKGEARQENREDEKMGAEDKGKAEHEGEAPKLAGEP